MSAPSYQDKLQAESTSVDQTEKPDSVISIFAICLSVLVLSSGIGSLVTQWQSNSIIAEYQLMLDVALDASRQASELQQMPIPRPTPTGLQSTQPSPPPAEARKNPLPPKLTTPRPPVTPPTVYYTPPPLPANGFTPAPGRG